jgi:hypothetical protein
MMLLCQPNAVSNASKHVSIRPTIFCFQKKTLNEICHLDSFVVILDTQASPLRQTNTIVNQLPMVGLNCNLLLQLNATISYA